MPVHTTFLLEIRLTGTIQHTTFVPTFVPTLTLEATVATRTDLLPELQLHVDLVRHRLARLPAVFLPVILLESLLVLSWQPGQQADKR